MILTYKQTVARKYELVTLEDAEYIVAHNSKAFSKTLEIEIYKTATNDITFGNNDADLIYEVLEKATTPKLILDFCQKYGTLINANSPIIDGRYFRTNKIIEANAITIDVSTLTEHQQKCLTKSTNSILDLPPTLSSDHMNINHFYYYVNTLIMLDELYEETIASLSFDSAVKLIKQIEKYCSCVETMLSFEYDLYVELRPFLTAFPFYLYNYLKIDCLSKHCKFEHELAKSNSFLANLSEIIKEVNSNTEQHNAYDRELFIIRVKEIATQIYADIINFHIKDIPFSLLTAAKFDPLCDSFYSLGDAILFQKILNLTSSTRKIRCHDETCRKLFVPSNSTTKYCCSDCRKRHHTRESMRKKRAKNKNIANKN